MIKTKFRAWDKKEKKMCNDALIIGNMGLGEGSVVVTEDVEKGNELIWMQFTGLKDKNGKEIFEGDIFKDNVGGEDYLIVIYYKDRFGLLSNNCKEIHDGMPLDFALHKFLEHTGKEVIGNIYENEELLEEKK